MHITLAHLQQTFSLGKTLLPETASQSFYVPCRVRIWDKYSGTVDLFVYQTIVYKSPLVHFVNFAKAYIFSRIPLKMITKTFVRLQTHLVASTQELSPPRYNVGGSKSTLLG